MNYDIDVREHGRTPLPTAVVDATPTEFWKSVDCEVTKNSGDDRWILKAGNSVGVARIRTPEGYVNLQVKPKLDTADAFFLADYAYEQRHEPLRLLDYDDVGLESAARDPTACLLVWHAHAIRRFAARWLRRDYQKTTRVLDGKVRGRILVNRYVSGHLAVGDAARIPCRIQERTQDTPNNRLLKAGLRFIATVSHDLPVPAARRAVLRQVSAALPLFAQVSDIRVSPSDIRALSTRGPQRHYATVLDATIALLRSQFMGDESSTTPTTSAFMWQMPILFQEAVRGILDAAPDLQLVNSKPGTASIHAADGTRRRTSKVDPDLVLRSSNGKTLLVDTKYKNALPSDHTSDDEDVTAVAERHRIRISRSDIYQVVAYRQHETWPSSKAALLYPLVLADGDELPAPMQVRGFGDEVLVLFIDIGRRASTNLPAFLSVLRGLADQQTMTLTA
ncbi:5-methylcytosine restriction system specificity protein McrC [Branchiibius cervicis]|uniref:Restriction endonuclease n=1 Tax=Branchiibius cervicis TaxID=908252 RepID=A0ABW2AV98_9MICO